MPWFPPTEPLAPSTVRIRLRPAPGGRAKVDIELGTGKKKRQIAIVEGRIKDGILFPSVAIALQQRLNSLLEREKTKLGAILVQVANGVEADLRCVLDSDAGKSQEVARLAVDRGELQKISERLKVLKARAEEVRRAAFA